MKDKRTYADRREENIAAVNKRRRKMKRLLLEEHGNKCSKCSYDKCVAALEFHHPDPTVKESKVIGSTASYARQKAEADKCVLLCANCHREAHYEGP